MLYENLVNPNPTCAIHGSPKFLITLCRSPFIPWLGIHEAIEAWMMIWIELGFRCVSV